jgi:hypothetical protein
MALIQKRSQVIFFGNVRGAGTKVRQLASLETIFSILVATYQLSQSRLKFDEHF